MIELPHKLWQLLEIALRDVKATEGNPKFRLDMETWYRPAPAPQDRCTLCLAGSVMANTLEYGDAVEIVSPSGMNVFGDHNKRALIAINCLRKGQVQVALDVLEYGHESWLRWNDDDPDTHELSREIIAYDEGREIWHEQMNDLLKDLKEANA